MSGKIYLTLLLCHVSLGKRQMRNRKREAHDAKRDSGMRLAFWRNWRHNREKRPFDNIDLQAEMIKRLKCSKFAKSKEIEYKKG